MSEHTHRRPESLDEFTTLCANDERVVDSFNSYYGTSLKAPVDVTLLRKQIGTVCVFSPNLDQVEKFQRWVERIWSDIQFTSGSKGHGVS